MSSTPSRLPDSARSPAVERFVKSMMLDMDQWRDGEGFDVSALVDLPPVEAEYILRLLEERLSNSGAGWREVEAVAVLGTPGAEALLAGLVHHPSPEVRLRAARRLDDRDAGGKAEMVIVRLLQDPDTDIGAAALFGRAEEHPTEPVRKALRCCSTLRASPRSRSTGAIGRCSSSSGKRVARSGSPRWQS